MFVVCATLYVKPDQLDDFTPLMLTNAAASLADEPGCHRFDVCQGPQNPTEIFLYELYTDAAAFQAHLKTPHFLTFDAAVADMLTDKSVKTYQLID